jgi:hypothetical protein
VLEMSIAECGIELGDGLEREMQLKSLAKAGEFGDSLAIIPIRSGQMGTRRRIRDGAGARGAFFRSGDNNQIVVISGLFPGNLLLSSLELVTPSHVWATVHYCDL